MWMQRRKLSVGAGEKNKRSLEAKMQVFFICFASNLFSCMATSYFFFNSSLWFLTLWQVHKCWSFCFLCSQQENDSLIILMTHCLLVVRKTPIFHWRGLPHWPVFCPQWGKLITKINILLFNLQWSLILVLYCFILCRKQNKTKQTYQIFCLLCDRPFKGPISHSFLF